MQTKALTHLIKGLDGRAKTAYSDMADRSESGSRAWKGTVVFPAASSGVVGFFLDQQVAPEHRGLLTKATCSVAIPRQQYGRCWLKNSDLYSTAEVKKPLIGH